MAAWTRSFRLCRAAGCGKHRGRVAMPVLPSDGWSLGVTAFGSLYPSHRGTHLGPEALELAVRLARRFMDGPEGGR
jgi:hypothetical protein